MHEIVLFVRYLPLKFIATRENYRRGPVLRSLHNHLLGLHKEKKT